METRDDHQPSATIYSKPGCVQCVATKREFDKLSLSYTVIDVSADHAAREALATMGYQSVPVVFTANQRWTGFRPDRISALAKGANTIDTAASCAPSRPPLDADARRWAQATAARMRTHAVAAPSVALQR